MRRKGEGKKNEKRTRDFENGNEEREDQAKGFDGDGGDQEQEYDE
jgi:hypothetical protein